MAKKAGRPSTFNHETADRICGSIATSSKSVRTILKEVGIDYETHLRWLRNNEEYANQYARAKEDQADVLAEEIIQIADDGSNDTYIDKKGKVQVDMELAARSRLRVDARKWVAAKLKPKKYGDKVDLTTDGKAITAPVINVLPKSET